jgi:peptidoglycan/LPS O-acetylase OafA/YrhL
MQYRREIDGLRALAVLPAILFHAGFPLFSGGFIGVDIFFVISGYLITSIILAEMRTGTFSIAAFYERRIRRILPALFVMMTVCIPLAWIWMLPSELKDFSKSMISVPLFVSNYYFRQDVGYFAAAADEKPLLHTWSLAVEEQYYLFFPALVCMLWGAGRRCIVPLLIAAAAISFGYALWQIGIDSDSLFFDTRGRAWEILAGSFISFYNASRFYRAPSRTVQEIGSLAGLSLILGGIFLFDETFLFPSAYTLVPILGAVLIILFSTPSTLAGKLLGTKALVGIGLISYSAYLWHQPALAFARVQSFQEMSDTTRFGLCIVSLALAYISWRFVEQPFRNRATFATPSVVKGAICLSVAMMALGFVGYYNKGFDGRFADSQATIRKTFAKENHQRVKLSRPGQCHYTGKHGYIDINKFLKHWKCTEDPENPNLKKIPLIVVGDSHAADIVAAFKTNGYLPVHMAGSGCSLIPRVMSDKCKKQFEYIKEFAKNNPYYTHIVLTNRMSLIEASPRAIQSMVDYWSMPGKQLIYLTSRPEFPKYERALILKREPEANFNRASFTSAPEILEILQSNHVQVINSKEIFCSLTPQCASHEGNGAPLTTDGHHFTRRGAELFGKRIIDLGLVPVSPALAQ